MIEKLSPTECGLWDGFDARPLTGSTVIAKPAFVDAMLLDQEIKKKTMTEDKLHRLSWEMRAAINRRGGGWIELTHLPEKWYRQIVNIGSRWIMLDMKSVRHATPIEYHLVGINWRLHGLRNPETNEVRETLIEERKGVFVEDATMLRLTYPKRD